MKIKTNYTFFLILFFSSICYGQLPANQSVICPELPSEVINKKWQWFLCQHSVKLDPSLSHTGIDIPMSFVAPVESSFNKRKPARIFIYLHPNDGGLGHFVTGRSSFSYLNNWIEIHDQEDSYSTNPQGSWWGLSGGHSGKIDNYNGKRIASSINYITKRFGNNVDLNKGIHIKGKSLGGTGAILQAFMLPTYQNYITSVDAIIANMLMIKCCKKTIQKAWGTKNLHLADFRQNIEKVKNIHFHWRGGSNDHLGKFDIEFFELCEKHKISCSGVWTQSGHNLSEKGVNLPRSMFLDPKQDVTLDKILPVITNSSANFHGKVRGHHNRSISWNHQNLEDTSTYLMIPLRYKALRNLGKDLPDQPASVTFSVTPRHLKNFKPQIGDTIYWKFGVQNGIYVIDKDNLITISGLTLESNNKYQVLKISKHKE